VTSLGLPLSLIFSEFLDSKDPSLAFAVYGASQLNIFPIAVLDVTTADSNKEELLLCFNGKLSDSTLKASIPLRATLSVNASFHILKFYVATNEKKNNNNNESGDGIVFHALFVHCSLSY